MENYRKSSHYTDDIKYYLVWIAKYRKPVITGKTVLRTRELMRMKYKAFKEWREKYQIEHEYLAYVENYKQVCIKIL